jgi:sulfur relay (sulfurtransferase) DsrC/TusE family protein
MTTFDRVCLLREGDATLSLGQIAERVGVTRQRVHQILKEDGLATARVFTSKHPPCPGCGKRRPWRHKREVCNACRAKTVSVRLRCDHCSVLFYRRRYYTPFNPKRASQNWIFCSKRCQGKNLAALYGFKVFPENAKYGRENQYHYDLGAVDLAHTAGQSYAQEARRQGVPADVIYGALHRRKVRAAR